MESLDFLNLNTKLRVGGRKVNLSGKSLDELLKGVFKKLCIEYDIDPNTDDYELIGDDRGIDLLGELRQICSKDFKYDINEENCTSEYGRTDTGVDYVKFLACVDGGVYTVIYAYSDGNKLRVYIPTKGNTVYPETKESFSEFWGMRDDILSVMHKRMPNFCKTHSDDEIEDYFNTEYDKFYQTIGYPDEDACLEDFTNRIEI